MEIGDVDFESVLNESKQILKKCFQEYNLEEIFLSFNGGKDCTVLLDLTLRVIKEIFEGDKTGDLRIVYIRTYSPFQELETFIHQAEKNYGLNLGVVEGGMKESLEKVLNENNRYKACLMGTRKTDPYCSELKHMQKTDEGWPQILRVSPLLNWSYHQIWSYLLKNNVPYCCLYDKGFTSIGSTANTIPNPSLQYRDCKGNKKYRPAYMLQDETQERDGRVVNNNRINGHPQEHS